MFTPVPQTEDFSSMIVAPQPEATDAGAQTLAAGGNAVDAAVATALVQGVVDPLMSGIGGMAIAQIVTPDGRVHIIDGLGTSPQAVTPDVWADKLLGPTTDGFGFRVEGHVNETGAQSIMTPGTLKTLEAIHTQFGRLAWSDLFAEAIRLARSGWPIRPHVHTVLTQNEQKYGRMDFGDKLANTADGRRIYLPHGTLPRLGDMIINPELADTLTHLAKTGATDLYTGELAGVIADSIRDGGGFLTRDDLAGYELQYRDPVIGRYRGLKVTLPPNPAGGVQTMQTLGILDRFDMGTIAHGSAAHIRILAEAMKHALRDKEDLWRRPTATDADYAALLTAEALDRAAAEVRAGHRVDVDGPRYADTDAGPDNESRHTTHISAMDADGLTVSLTHTLGNPSGFIPSGTGFMMNGGMSTFDPRPGTSNSVAPGARRRTTMAPTVVHDETGPVIAIGAPGASWITPAIVQGISNIIDFGMPVDRAVAAPRIVATSNAIDISNRIPRSVELALQGEDYEVRRSALSFAFAGVHAITRIDGRLAGGADPQRDGYAAGV